MSSSYRVRCVEWQALAINLPACDADDAMALAQTIREGRGTIDFEELDGGTDHWEAEPLPDAAAPQVDQLRTALTRLRSAAAKLDKAMSGASGKCADERRRLAEALAGVESVLSDAEGGAP